MGQLESHKDIGGLGVVVTVVKLSALSQASSKRSPCKITRTALPPKALVESTLMAGVVTGMTMVAAVRSVQADSATP